MGQVSGMSIARDLPERTSDIVARVARENQASSISVGQLVDALKDRSFGVILIFFALPNAVIPISWVLGVPILLLGLQMMIGRQEPWLPNIMERQQIGNETFNKIAAYVVKYLSKIESLLKPRWCWLSTDLAERFIGAYIVFLAAVLIVPVPFGNALPAFGISIIAAGLIEKDGVAVLVGALVGLAGFFYVATVLGGAWAAFTAIFGF